MLDLNPVKVQDNPNYGNWEVGPDHVNIYKEKAKSTRNIKKFEAHDIALRNANYSTNIPESISIKPWKIIIYYSTVPDLDLDCSLDLHPLQDLTGGSHGHRHMQFKLFFKTVGCTEKCFSHYFNETLKAWKDKNQYWGYRYLSRATHYLADLGHPFHVKVAPYSKLFKYLFRLKNFKKYLTAAHNGHEVYVQYRLRQGFSPFKKAIQRGSSQGSEEAKSQPIKKLENILQKIKEYRKHSAKLLKPMFNAIIEGFGEDLIACYNVDELKPEYQKLDYSKQCMMMEHKAQKVIFRDEHHNSLKKLDHLTEDALYEVGYMLGYLYGILKNKLPNPN